MQLSNVELNNYIGGGINATFLNAIVRGFTFLLDLGKSIGTSIRRGTSGQICGL